MIFSFLKQVQENVTNSAPTSTSEMFSEADQSALMATYEDAVLICESLQANMVRASLASSQLFGESAATGSEELYIAAMFDKAKGLFVSIWKVIVDAFKAVTNWIKGLFGKVTKATSKNIEQIDKLSKLILLKTGEIGEYGKDWSIPEDFKLELKSPLMALSAAVIGYTLWGKNKFDSLKLSSDYTAGDIFKEKMEKGVQAAIVKLMSGDDKSITADDKSGIVAAGKSIEDTVNSLKSNNLSGMSGEGADRKAKQLKFFISGLLFMTPEKFFAGHELVTGRADQSLTIDKIREICDAIVDKITNEHIDGLVRIITGEGKLNFSINKMVEDLLKDSRINPPDVAHAGQADQLIEAYIKAAILFDAGQFMSIPENTSDVKGYLMKSIFDDRLDLRVDKSNFVKYHVEMSGLMVLVGTWLKENSVKTMQNKFAEGEKFFGNIAKEYQVIYDQMKKVVDNNTNISGRENMNSITSALNGMVKNAGELTSWFTTGIIQTYAIGDMLTSRGLGETMSALNTYSNILNNKIVVAAK